MTRWASCLLFSLVLPDPHHQGECESEKFAVRRLALGAQFLVGNRQLWVGTGTQVTPLALRKGASGPVLVLQGDVCPVQPQRCKPFRTTCS